MPELLHLRAAVAASSLDREARTVEAIASTGADVQRLGFTERLPVAAADLSNFVGAPVLNTHRHSDVGDVLGAVEGVRREGGKLIVKLRLTRRAESAGVIDDIEDGALRGVSLGYRVDAWRDERAPGGALIRTATKWTPLEASLVPIPADPGATIRSEQMPDPIETPAPASAAPPAPNPSRAEINREIRSIGEVTSLGSEWADGQIDAEATVEAARAAAFEAMQTRSAPTIRVQRASVGVDHDAPETRAVRAGEALYARMNPSHELSESARAFAHMTMPDLARESLRHRGQTVTGLSPSALVTRALHTTSDFPLILGDATNRTLRAAYQAAPSGLRMLARQTTARDFRAKNRIQMGEAPVLEPVSEAGEFTSGTLAEAAESYRLGTFGRIVGVSRPALVNDDLGAFQQVPARMGQAAAAFEAQTMVALLEGNPAMSDGAALFHASHGNLAGTAAALDAATLAARRTAMRKQTGLSGEPIAATPRYLLVPPELEDAAMKLVADITPHTTADVNVNSALNVVVENRLTSATAFYVVAAPAEIDGLEFAYLEGEPGPQIETRAGFEVDGVQIKVRLDFGAGFVDWRGWQKNAGA
ncbi:MAG: prohead protease/major capsid protein fusion protein [Pseudomonadota bacterium]